MSSLLQTRLTKAEWTNVEIPVAESEKMILDMMIKAYNDENICINTCVSLMSYTKIEYEKTMEDFLFVKYFANTIKEIRDTYNYSWIVDDNRPNKPVLHVSELHVAETTDMCVYIRGSNIVKLKSAQLIRIDSVDRQLSSNVGGIALTTIYECVLMDLVKKMLAFCPKWLYYYYTLYHLNKNTVHNLNIHVKTFIEFILQKFYSHIDLMQIVCNGKTYIEQNPYLLKYNDISLYQHQKDLIKYVKDSMTLDENNIADYNALLVLYSAPTGTGKTISPVSLLNGTNRVIFVCAARHVSLALAKASISMGKKIAFAFGCESAKDIRLHYFAAKEYTVNTKSGGIYKVDNERGEKVELMICDLASYLIAMYYMLSFNDKNNLIMYWDEPTISMDYEDHFLHPVAHRVWAENEIPKIVLSSATLPQNLHRVIADFELKFNTPNSKVKTIKSYDCKKTISLYNPLTEECIAPHKPLFGVNPEFEFETHYRNILEIVDNCESNLTLLRYIDLEACCQFITNTRGLTNEHPFTSIDKVNMQNIKLYYLELLKTLPMEDIEVVIREELREKEKEKEKEIIASKIHIMTSDAHILTNGPTIYIANDLQKIAGFCIGEAKIPVSIINEIYNNIEYNNKINEMIAGVEEEIATAEENTLKKMTSTNASANANIKDSKRTEKKANNAINKSTNKTMNQLRGQLEQYRSLIKTARLHDLFIPNKLSHLEKWHTTNMNMNTLDVPFTSDIQDSVISEIMQLTDIQNSWNILLLLGIGVFTEHCSVTYTELMKKLANEQKLFLIIADSDKIYGYNFQFCHGYMAKDLHLTQEKIIQCLGRIGRGNVQHNYTVHFRNTELVQTLFYPNTNIMESDNMNRLFIS